MRDTRPDGDGASRAPGGGRPADDGAWRALAASVEAWLPVQVRGRPTDESDRRDAGERR